MKINNKTIKRVFKEIPIGGSIIHMSIISAHSIVGVAPKNYPLYANEIGKEKKNKNFHLPSIKAQNDTIGIFLMSHFGAFRL